VSQELNPYLSSPPNAAPGACARCGQQLAPDALECGQCHTLVNEAAVERIAARARAYEANGNLPTAREEWLNSLRLLPPDSGHARWVSAHVQELGATIQSVHGNNNAGKWAKRLGPLAPLAVLLAKFKGIFFFLFKLKSLFSLAAFIGLYSAMFGWKFGVGFAGLILVHEMGHYVDVKRRGLPADMPVHSWTDAALVLAGTSVKLVGLLLLWTLLLEMLRVEANRASVRQPDQSVAGAAAQPAA